ncbi:MAG: hypothetical protein C4534_03450 [Gaiellales bacterium]|nr:MAG: hypothetical protein C4534_03450 [Gaiellales bacterium]
MDRSDLLSKAMFWMQARGWRHKLAKRRGYEQSLFEHSLIELDVLIELFPILAGPRHYGLSEAEKKILAVAVLVHDVGKETEAWQAYIRDPKPDLWVSHVTSELTRMVVPGLCTALGLEELGEPVQRIMAHCAEFHHSQPGRSDGAIIEAMLTGGSDRFLTLAYLVKGLDHLCSAASAAEAEDVVVGDPELSRHLKVARHEVLMRGVSTTFLHHATQTAFQQRGWKPFLYFSTATVYAADPTEAPTEPTAEEIRAALKKETDAAIAGDVTQLMVGSPTGNILPKPDLFSFPESRKYLQSAGKKISPLSFARKPLRAKRKVVEDYWKLKGRSAIPTDTQVEEEAGRISVAQPEMLVFKFFKAMMDPEKVEAISADGAALARKLYEQSFGRGSWAALQSTSTIMPAKDMARTVDYFWALLGSAVGRPQNETVETIHPDERQEILINLLDGIAQQVFTAIDKPSPRAALSQKMAEAFSGDLLKPTAVGNVQALAQKQLDHYARSKPFAGKESAKGIYFCPICNAPFDLKKKEGIKASADFIDNPQTHTNRGVAYGSFGYIMVCASCYYERLLLQTLLGSRPAEMITLLPRLNLGPGKGKQLIRKVREWTETAKAQMRGDTGNLESGFSFGFTDQAARHLGERDPFSLEPEELPSIFSYRFTTDTQKKRRQEAMKRLKEEFDEDLNALKIACEQSFATWEEAVQALIDNRIDQQDCRAIRREVFRLYETIHLICQTPNLIFIPLSYEVAVGNDESETSKGLRRLYVALLLSLVFDASVAIHKEGDPVDFQGKAGAAYVPPVPAVRSLVEYDWLPITEAKQWLVAIGAASQLVRDSGLPARSALYQILAADPPEKMARRIEEGGGKNLTAHHLRLIERLPGFHAIRS